MKISIYNTLSKKVENLTSIKANTVKVYACGPTVYNFAHIGNLRTYIFEDLLIRVLRASELNVLHVMNVTDVGHLQHDSDLGDDKMLLASRREKKDPSIIAKFYEKAFFLDLKKLNIFPPNIICRATEHIKDMQQMIFKLNEKKVAYLSNGNMYFSVAEFKDYTELSGRNLNELLDGSRIDVDFKKKNPHDFVLWFSNSKFKNHIMNWDSPWGNGFPGWHIECSAMASKYLGNRIDLHLGGVDHISVHHTNEIAQTESFFDKKWVKYWIHGEFLKIDDEKMSKSQNNFFNLLKLKQLGFEPIHYRYFCLNAHYRTQLSFNLKALKSSKKAFENLKNRVINWKSSHGEIENSKLINQYLNDFWDTVTFDLDTPKALAILWKMTKDSELSSCDKLFLIKDFDKVLGFGVENFSRKGLPSDLDALILDRETARKNKNWKLADEIRHKLKTYGIALKDSALGTNWYHEDERHD